MQHAALADGLCLTVSLLITVSWKRKRLNVERNGGERRRIEWGEGGGGGIEVTRWDGGKREGLTALAWNPIRRKQIAILHYKQKLC